jgi:hypothetical protein
VVNKIYIEKSFLEPQKVPKNGQVGIVTSDYYDTDDIQLGDVDIILTDEDLREIEEQ